MIMFFVACLCALLFLAANVAYRLIFNEQLKNLIGGNANEFTVQFINHVDHNEKNTEQIKEAAEAAKDLLRSYHPDSLIRKTTLLFLKFSKEELSEGVMDLAQSFISKKRRRLIVIRIIDLVVSFFLCAPIFAILLTDSLQSLFIIIPIGITSFLVLLDSSVRQVQIQEQFAMLQLFVIQGTTIFLSLHLSKWSDEDITYLTDLPGLST